MRFQVSAETLEGVETVCLRDSANEAATHILPQLGGTVWRLALADGSGSSGVGGGTSGGRYRFEGQDYELPLNEPESGCAVHGLVYDKPFAEDLREADDTHGVLQLSYRLGAESSPGYPFALLVTARYHLNADGFELSLGTLNEGEGPAPVTIGWHPYIAT